HAVTVGAERLVDRPVRVVTRQDHGRIKRVAGVEDTSCQHGLATGLDRYAIDLDAVIARHLPNDASIFVERLVQLAVGCQTDHRVLISEAIAGEDDLAKVRADAGRAGGVDGNRSRALLATEADDALAAACESLV